MGNDTFITPPRESKWLEDIERYKNAPFEPWQVDNEKTDYAFVMLPKAVLFKSDISPIALRVYLVLCDRQMASINEATGKFIDDEGYYYIIFRREQLAKGLHLSERTISRAIKELKASGLIYVQNTPAGLPQKIYVCHPQW